MTTKAIEAGARALARTFCNHWFDSGLATHRKMTRDFVNGSDAWRAEAQACIEAALASGELVPASADRTTLHAVISDIREKSGLGARPMLSELADAIAAKIASAVAAERERCAKVAEHPRFANVQSISTTKGPAWTEETGNAELCNSHARRIAAAIRALSPEPASGEYVVGWRTMDSAPKDTSEVIVLCGRKDVRLGWYFAPSATTFGWRDQHNAPIKPTHWMPRPKWPAMLNAATKDGERA